MALKRVASQQTDGNVWLVLNSETQARLCLGVLGSGAGASDFFIWRIVWDLWNCC